MLADDERTLPTPHPKLRIARGRATDGNWLPRLLEWLRPEGVRSDEEVKAGLGVWLPEYHCDSTAAPSRRTATAPVSLLAPAAGHPVPALKPLPVEGLAAISRDTEAVRANRPNRDGRSPLHSPAPAPAAGAAGPAKKAAR